VNKSEGGERMNKKNLIFVFGLIMLFSVIAPTIAGSPNKTPVTVTITGIDGMILPPEIRVTKGGIQHLEYFSFWGTIGIAVEGEATAIPVEWVDICVGTYNPKNNKAVYRFDEVWTLPNGDTFEGTGHITTEGDLFGGYTHMTAHIILHGTGDYEGQLLSLRSDIDHGGLVEYAGYWLKR
jgi:hypothetical protein